MLTHLVNLLLRLALDPPILITPQLPLVSPPERQAHQRVNTHGKHQHPDRRAVPRDVSRRMSCVIQKGSRNTSSVTDGDENTRCKSTLAVTWLVDSDPSHAAARTSPETGGHEEAADEGHGHGAVREEQRVADDHDESARDTSTLR